MGNSKSYKETLNLPKTDFDMRANLLTKEPAIQKRWGEQDLYGQIRRARQSRELGARLTRVDGERAFLDEIPETADPLFDEVITETVSCGPDCAQEGV